MEPERLHITRRNLPHWELGGSTYFLTYRCATGITLCELCREAVLKNWRHWDGRRYLLHTAIVMPDHVHALATPLPKPTGEWFTLAEILHTNKGYTAHEVNRLLKRHGTVWQDERYDRIVRNDEEFWAKWLYIAENSVRAGLVRDPLEYTWLCQNALGVTTPLHDISGQRPEPP